jgi:hypothetical protein
VARPAYCAAGALAKAQITLVGVAATGLGVTQAAATAYIVFDAAKGQLDGDDD